MDKRLEVAIDAARAAGEVALRYFRTEAMFVTPSTDTGLRILYENPREVGADRVVNAVAAFHKYGGPCVVVDLGTAITFDAISAQAEYLGGLICAGVAKSHASPTRRQTGTWWRRQETAQYLPAISLGDAR